VNQKFIVTGGNRGLGFQIARHLALESETEVVLAVRNPELGREAARRLGPNVTAEQLDLGSSESVARFVAQQRAPIAGLVNNAGTQVGNATVFTDDGPEITFAVNHLNALKLTLELLPKLHGGRVMFIGSGTHNPNHPTASRFGFRGERFRSIENCARGLEDGDHYAQLGKDRYATSKFLSLVTTIELARRIDRKSLLVFCLDPGLMPGTGLARTAPWWMRFGWHYVLPIVARLLPDASTTVRSGKAAARQLLTERDQVEHGQIYTYQLKPTRLAIPRVFDPEIGRRVLDDSLEMLGKTPDCLQAFKSMPAPSTQPKR